MKKLFAILSATVAGALVVSAATSPFYINNSPITTANRPPQIDARVFINHSEFDVFTTLAYQALHVQYWTNDFPNLAARTRSECVIEGLNAANIVFVCEHGAAKSLIGANYFDKLAAEPRPPESRAVSKIGRASCRERV